MAEPTERPILFSGPMVTAIRNGRKTQTHRLIDMKRLRVRLAGVVRSDLSDVMPGALTASAGIHRATMNGYGAVSVSVGGQALGVRPSEFDFECPYASGVTRLEHETWVIHPIAESRLWVKETFSPDFVNDVYPFSGAVWYREDVGRYDDPTLSDCIEHRESPMPTDCLRCHNDGRGSTFRWRPSIYMPRRASRITLVVTQVRVQRLTDISPEDALAEGIATTEDPVLGFEKLWDSINLERGPWATNPWVWAITFRVLSLHGEGAGARPSKTLRKAP